MKGKIIECPKHNGRFNLIDGSPARAPVCRGLATYPLEERNGRLRINVVRAGGAGARAQKTYQFRVVSNRNVATFIKELVLEPLDRREEIAFTPGRLPAARHSRLRSDPFPRLRHSRALRHVWENQHVFDLVAHNSEAGRRNNYSLASNQQTGAHTALQRPHRHAAAGPGLRSRRRLQLRLQPQARRHRHRHRPLRRFPHQAHPARDGLHRRRRRHGSAARPSLPSS